MRYKPHVHVRLATTGDLPLLQRLYRSSSAHWPDTRELVAQHPEWIEPTVDQVERGCVTVVEDAGELLGFSAVVQVAGEPFELDALFVDPNAMRRGVGRTLIDVAPRPLRVVANLNAVPFYEEVGFAAIGRVETLFGPALRMELLT